MHKTGSSAIQEALAGYDDGTVRYADLGQPNHSVPLATIFADDPDHLPSHRLSGRSAAEVDALRQRWRLALEREMLGPCSQLILSAEALTTNRLSAAALGRLREFLEASGRSVRPLAYVRDPISFANSAFQQRLRGGETRLSVPRPNYRKRFEKIVEVFGRERAAFVEYDRARFPGGSVVRDFADRAGVAPDRVPNRNENPRMCQDAAAMLLEFNRDGPQSIGTPALARARQRLIRLLRFDLDGPPFKLPDAWLGCAVHVPDLAWLDAHTGVAFEIDAAVVADARKPAPDAALAAPSEASRARLAELARGFGLHARDDAPSLALTTALFEHFLATRTQRSH